MKTDMQQDDSLRLLEHGLCPNCGSHQIKVVQTKRPCRRMACRDCKAKWKTVTVNLWDPEALEKVAEKARTKRDLEEKYPALFEMDSQI